VGDVRRAEAVDGEGAGDEQRLTGTDVGVELRVRDVVGAFTIDSLGAPYITRIDGDPSTVVGLSLPTLRRLVTRLGYDWPTLWNRGTSALPD
jgi:hypothetical protein